MGETGQLGDGLLQLDSAEQAKKTPPRLRYIHQDASVAREVKLTSSKDQE